MVKKRNSVNLVFVLAASVIVLSGAVISFSIHTPTFTNQTSQSSFAVQAYESPDTTNTIKTSNRKPFPNPDNVIDINNIQIGDQVGNVILRELKPVDYLYSKTPQTDNFAITFQGKIAIEGRFNDCFYPTNTVNLPKFSDPLLNSSQQICFDNPKTTEKLLPQLTHKSQVTVIVDNLTLSRYKTNSSKTATLLSVDTTK